MMVVESKKTQKKKEKEKKIMLKGFCRSNDDELNEFEWPTRFECRPLPGECVLSICQKRVAEVSRITHATEMNATPAGSIIIVELKSIGMMA